MSRIAARSPKWSVAFLACLSIGWVACVQVVQTAPPQEPPPRTPDPFTSMEDPVLEPTDQPGLFKASSLDPNCYFIENDGAWYRFAYNSWYQAFRWDGAWFQLRPQDVPKVLAGRVKIQPNETLKERLKEQERRLEEIDRQERLEEQERRLEEIDRQEREERAGAASEGAPSQ